MSKVKDISKGVGVSAAVIVYFIVFGIVSLVVAYFGIKFVMHTGDKVFNKTGSSSSSQSLPQDDGTGLTKNNPRYHTSSVDICMQNGMNRDGCECVYNGVWAEFSTAEIRQMHDANKANDQQTTVYNKIYANCGSDTNFYNS